MMVGDTQTSGEGPRLGLQGWGPQSTVSVLLHLLAPSPSWSQRNLNQGLSCLCRTELTRDTLSSPIWNRGELEGVQQLPIGPGSFPSTNINTSSSSSRQDLRPALPTAPESWGEWCR